MPLSTCLPMYGFCKGCGLASLPYQKDWGFVGEHRQECMERESCCDLFSW